MHRSHEYEVSIPLLGFGACTTPPVSSSMYRRRARKALSFPADLEDQQFSKNIPWKARSSKTSLSILLKNYACKRKRQA
jgi:hypothetical protein